MIIYRVSGNPVKSRVSGLFPKKCPIHNSASRVEIVPDINPSIASCYSDARNINKMNAITFSGVWCLFQFQIVLGGTYEPETKYHFVTLNDFIPMHQAALSIRCQHVNAWYKLFLSGYVDSNGIMSFYSNIKFWDTSVMVWAMWPYRRNR